MGSMDNASKVAMNNYLDGTEERDKQNPTDFSLKFVSIFSKKYSQRQTALFTPDDGRLKALSIFS